MPPVESELEVIISLRDQISAVMQRISNQFKNNLGGIQSNVKQAQTGMSGLGKGMDTVASSVANLTGIVKLLSFAAVINELKQAVVESINWASQLDRLSNITGIGAEKLQKYQFALKLANVETGEFQFSLRILQLRARAAIEGNEEAIRSFLKVGVDLRKNAELAEDTDALFRAVIDGLAKLQSRSEKMATGNELLGRSFARLLPAIKDGTASIDEMGKRLEDLGGVVDEKTVQSLDNTSKKLDVLNTLWTAAKARISETITEGLNPLVEGFLKVVRALQPVVMWLKRWILINVELRVALFDIAKLIAEKIIPVFMALGKVMKAAFTRDPVEAFKATQEAIDAIKGLGDIPKGVGDRVGGMWERFKEIFKETGEEADANVEKIDENINKVGELFNKIDQSAEKAKDFKFAPIVLPSDEIVSVVERTIDDLKILEERYEKTGDKTTFYAKQIETLKKAKEEVLRIDMRDGVINDIEALDAFTKAIELSEDQLKAYNRERQQIEQDKEFAIRFAEEGDLVVGFGNALRDFRRQFFSFKDAFLNIFNTMERGFSTAIESMISGGKKFKDIMKGFFRDIKASFIKMLADMAARNIMASLLGGRTAGGGAGLLGGLLGGGGGGAATGAAAGGAAGGGGLLSLLGGAGGAGIGGLMGLLPAAALFGGLGLGMGGVEAGEPLEAGAGLALSGGLLGLQFGGPIGAAIGGIVGLGAGLIGGKREEQKMEKMKQQQEAELERQQAMLEEQRRKAAELIKTQVRTTLGGGLATPEAAMAAGELLGGDISAGEIEQFGGPGAVLSRQGEIEALASVSNINVGAPVITVNANISGTYDVALLAQDLGYHFVNTIQAAAASNP